jgi:hypothetical protein
MQSRCYSIVKSGKLYDLEDQVIFLVILDLDSQEFPPRHRGVEKMANRLLTNRHKRVERLHKAKQPVGKFIRQFQVIREEYEAISDRQVLLTSVCGHI